MFVKAQEFDRVVNINKIVMIDIEEISDHFFRIIAECENDFRVLLAVYADGKDAEKYFDLLCQAIVNEDKLFRFPDDPKRMQEEKDDH